VAHFFGGVNAIRFGRIFEMLEAALAQLAPDLASSVPFDPLKREG